jgi:cardiolipin synthase (CMP-forming)
VSGTTATIVEVSGPALADAEAAVPTGRGIVTLPNVLSLGRLACIPVFLWLLFGRDDRLNAALLLGFLGATDWIDGSIARRFGQVSELGKVLDPTADRLLFIVGVAGIIVDRSAPMWLSILVVVREVVISVLLVTLTLLGMKRFPVTWWGKAATFALMFAFPLFLLGAADAGRWSDVGLVTAWIFAIPGLIISYITFFAYLPTMRRALADGRRERQGNSSPTSNR